MRGWTRSRPSVWGRSLLILVCVSFPFPAWTAPPSPITIPHYDAIQRLRTEFYNLNFLESRFEIQQMIQQTEDPVRATYQTVFHYAELTALLGDNAQHHVALFDQQSDEALRQLKEYVDAAPNNPVWRLYLGLVYGLKSGVAIAFHQSYWDAYRYGTAGVSIFEDIRDQYPTFYDSFLSSGILKIMIAQSSWIIRTLAPILLTEGSLEEGSAHLDLVLSKGAYVQEEAQLFHLVLTSGEVPNHLRLKSVQHLLAFLKKYPENPQLYFFIAKGYWKMGRYSQADRYALRGLQQLRRQKTQFVNRYRMPLQAFLLRIRYRYLVRTRQWHLLLRRTGYIRDPSGVSQAYRAYALKKLKRDKVAIRLAERTLPHLNRDHLAMPLFISPYMFSMEESLTRFLHKYVLELEER